MKSTSKCSRCGKPAKIELRYSGESLCNSCFVRRFEKRVRRTIRLGRLFNPKDKIAVALSGGKDSAVALYVLKGLCERIPSSELIAITIDPGIKDYQKRFLDSAREFCEELGVRHYIYSFKEEFGFTLDEVIKISRRLDNPAPPCSYCGVFRRKLLNEKVMELGTTKIATGHNLDDEVQTAMMNFIRGDLDRIARMGAMVGVIKDRGFVPRVKPLRECPEREVNAYAGIKRLRFQPGKCPYSGEAFRGTIRDAVDKMEKNHPGSKFQILKSTDTLVEILRGYKRFGKIGKCRECGGLTSGDLCKMCEIKALLEL